MYCPKCGNPDQQPESYCRKCGLFLPDLVKKKKEVSAEAHLKANAFLSLATAFVSLSFAIALYAVFLGREDTPLLIYLVAGFLIAITAWQVQVFIRTRMLRKQVARMQPKRDDPHIEIGGAEKAAGLPEAAMDHIVPPSVTERTTRHLAEKLSKPEH